MEIRTLTPDDVSLLATIDRSERIATEYRVIDGQLVGAPAEHPDVTTWDPVGVGPHTVAGTIDFARHALARGGVLLGTFAGEQVRGLTIVVPRFEPKLAWFALLYVTRSERRQGVAQALWNATVDIAREAGDDAMYVSAAPTESAVGFYLRQGCVLADPPHAELFAHEPDDIHLLYPFA